jgi:hypothetical protein
MKVAATRFFGIVGAFNPLPFFPAKVYPIFQETGKNARQDFFLQVLGGRLQVVDFMLHREIPKDQFLPLHYNGPPVRVGDLGFQIIAISSVDVYVCRGEEQLRDCLAGILGKMEYSLEVLDPFFGLEAAQYLQLEFLETRFAKACAQRILARNQSVAMRWVDSADLSELARAAVMDELTQVRKETESCDPDEEPEIVYPSIWQSRAFSSLHNVRLPDHSVGQIFDDLLDLMNDEIDISGALIFLHWGDNSRFPLDVVRKAHSLGAEVFAVRDPLSEGGFKSVTFGKSQSREAKLSEIGARFFTGSSRNTINLELERILQARSKLSTKSVKA